MRPDPRVLLADVDRAGADIERFIEGMDLEGYAIVIPERVWDYAENDLPELRTIVHALLAEMGPPEA